MNQANPPPLPLLFAFSPILKNVISTEAIHSLTVNRAAKKSAFLPMPPPSRYAFVFAFSCHPSPQAEDLLLSLSLPVLLHPAKTLSFRPERIHSLTVNRAAEKSAFLPRPHPGPNALVLTHSSYPGPP
jgi:hypothetical protein